MDFYILRASPLAPLSPSDMLLLSVANFCYHYDLPYRIHFYVVCMTLIPFAHIESIEQCMSIQRLQYILTESKNYLGNAISCTIFGKKLNPTLKDIF